MGQRARGHCYGTHIELIRNNLLGEHHVRYGRFGGIAYHHISDTYIALFSHFIACGVWEAVYIGCSPPVLQSKPLDTCKLVAICSCIV